MIARRSNPALTVLISPWTWFLIGTAIRLIYLFADVRSTALFAYPLLDEAEIAESARAYLAGESNPPEPLFRAPGYSAFVLFSMVLFGDLWPTGHRVLQAIFGGIACAAASILARHLCPWRPSRPLAAALAGALLAFYGPAIRLEATLTLDAPAATLLLLIALSLIQWARLTLTGLAHKNPTPTTLLWNQLAPTIALRLLLLSGSLFACLLLLRPTLLPSLLFLAPLLAWSTWARWRQTRLITTHTLAMVSPALITCLLLMLYNGTVSGDYRILPWQGSYNLYEANRLDGPQGRYLRQTTSLTALPTTNPSQLPTPALPLLEALQRPHPNPTRGLMIREFLQALTQPQAPSLTHTPFSNIDRWYRQRFLASLTQSPFAHARLFLIKATDLFSDREIYNYEDFHLQRDRSPLLSLFASRFGLILPLALASLLTLLGLHLNKLLPTPRLLLPLGYIAFIVIVGLFLLLGYTSGRMRLGWALLWIPLAALLPALFSQTLQSFPAHRLLEFSVRNPLLLTGLGGLLGLGLAFQNFTGVRSEIVAHWDLGRMSNAAWHAAQTPPLSRPDKPASDSAPQPHPKAFLSQALAFAGQARTVAQKADLPFPQVDQLMAQAYTSLARPQSARAAWEKATKTLPEEPLVFRNLGSVLLEEFDEPQSALLTFDRAIALGSLEARPLAAIAALRLQRPTDAQTYLAPFEIPINQLLTNPPREGQRPSIPSRVLVAAILTARALNDSRRADSLMPFLSPRALLELEVQAQALKHQPNPTPEVLP